MLKHNSNHQVSKSCGGEKCNVCSKQATHKVGEEQLDDNIPIHNLTAYLCCECFCIVMKLELV